MNEYILMFAFDSVFDKYDWRSVEMIDYLENHWYQLSGFLQGYIMKRLQCAEIFDSMPHQVSEMWETFVIMVEEGHLNKKSMKQNVVDKRKADDAHVESQFLMHKGDF